MQHAEQHREQHHRVVGRPFLPGQSGNPQGKASRRARHAALVRELGASLFAGIEPSPAERLVLDMIADLRLQPCATATDRVRVANAVDRLLRLLRHKAAWREPNHVPLRDRIGK
jgi:hypothetical protein